MTDQDVAALRQRFLEDMRIKGLQPKTQTLINKLRAAKKAAPAGEKPAVSRLCLLPFFCVF